MTRQDYLARTAKMLHEVFGGHRYSTRYLDWQYEQSPEGREIAVDIDDGAESLAHYCVIPQKYANGSEKRQFALSLNTAVTAKARGKGVFTRLAEETYEKARRDFGVSAIVGVANANSTPGFLGRLKFTLLGALPVHVGIANPFERSFVSSDASTAVPASVWESIDYSTFGWSHTWNPETIAWRLRSPLGPYGVHVHSSGVMITTVERRKLPIAVVLKVFPRQKAIDVRALLRAACHYHGTAFYLYAGFNSRVAIKGPPLPRRLRPSPLNLIYRPLDDSVPSGDQVKLQTFEFLDFDAY